MKGVIFKIRFQKLFSKVRVNIESSNFLKHLQNFTRRICNQKYFQKNLGDLIINQFCYELRESKIYKISNI